MFIRLIGVGIGTQGSQGVQAFQIQRSRQQGDFIQLNVSPEFDDIHLLWVLVPDHQVGHLSVFVVRVDQLLSELVVPAFDQFVFFRFIQYFPELADRFFAQGGIGLIQIQIENIHLFQFLQEFVCLGRKIIPLIKSVKAFVHLGDRHAVFLMVFGHELR